MNSSNSMGDKHSDGEQNVAGSVSRSGRVRKKNSLLDVYDSTDIIDKRRKRGEKAQKGSQNAISRSHQKVQAYKGKKSNYYGSANSPGNAYHSSDSYSSLDMKPYDGEVPDIAGEEVIDEGLLGDGRSGGSSNYRRFQNNVKLKSQAQSTYMLEKSFLKQRKVTGGVPGVKVKATRKDKGSSRITGYMLWAKSQTTQGRSIVDLRELWAGIPMSQKKLWKTKAAKIMKKKMNGAENMKNSAAGPSLTLARSIVTPPSQAPRKGMKNTTPQEVYAPKRPPGRPPKKMFSPQLTSTPTMVPGTSKKSNSSTTFTGKISPPKKMKTLAAATIPTLASSQMNSYLSQMKSEPYTFQVNGTNSLDVAAHLSLLGEQMKKLGEKIQSNKKDLPPNDSLSVLLDSLLCCIGPLLCLTTKVPEFQVPGLEETLKSILNNTDYIMPGF